MKVEGSSHVHVLHSSPSWPFGQREVAVPYRWGRVRLCKRYGVICTATPRHPGRPIMSHARAGRCATGVHRCFMRPGVSTPAVRDAAARRVALARGRVASFSSGASAAADDQDPPGSDPIYEVCFGCVSTTGKALLSHALLAEILLVKDLGHPYAPTKHT